MSDFWPNIVTYLSETQWQNTIATTIYTLAFMVIGVGFTLFTVFYSFIDSRRISIKSIEEKIRLSQGGAKDLAELKFAKHYVKTRKQMNNHVLIIILLSIPVCVCALCAQLCNVTCWKYYLFLTIVGGVYSLYLLIGLGSYLYHYYQDVYLK